MSDFHIDEEDGVVVVTRNGVSVRLDPPRARRFAARLAVGAEAARERHDFDDSLKADCYGVPGGGRLTQSDAIQMAWMAFSTAITGVAATSSPS